jgi:hypothetical protein
VANRVPDLNSSQLQPIIQHKTHTVLLEAEMELHNVPLHKEPVLFDSEPNSASYTVTSTTMPKQWRTQEFFSGAGVQQIHLRKEGRENGVWGRQPPSKRCRSICKWVTPVFLLGCYGCIFHGTENLAQLRLNFGISGEGSVWTSQTPLGTPLYHNLQVPPFRIFRL